MKAYILACILLGLAILGLAINGGINSSAPTLIANGFIVALSAKYFQKAKCSAVNSILKGSV